MINNYKVKVIFEYGNEEIMRAVKFKDKNAANEAFVAADKTIQMIAERARNKNEN